VERTSERRDVGVRVEAAKELVEFGLARGAVVVVVQRVDKHRLAEARRTHEKMVIDIVRFEQADVARVVDEELLLEADRLEIAPAVRERRRTARRRRQAQQLDSRRLCRHHRRRRRQASVDKP
jgi:hypothetical protein